MFWKKSKIDNEKLDELGKLLLKSAALTNEEAEQATSSPLLYNNLRTNIMKETLKRAEDGDNWIAIWFLARYALPVMAGIAVVAFSSFWILDTHIQQVTQASPANFLPEIVAPVTACSISSKSECVVSSNDVILIVFQEQTTEIKNESAK